MGETGSKQIDFSTIFRNPDQQMFPLRFGSDNDNLPRNNNNNNRIPGRTVDVHREVNTFGLIDNCYYTTLAGILGTTIDELTTRTEIWQERNGANLEQIDTLYRVARLPIHRLYSFDNIGDLELFLNRANIGERVVALPFGYQISPQMNHMVALYVRRDPATGRIDGRLVDYQLNADDPRRINFQIPHSGKYCIFDTEQLFPSMHDDL